MNCSLCFFYVVITTDPIEWIKMHRIFVACESQAMTEKKRSENKNGYQRLKLKKRKRRMVHMRNQRRLLVIVFALFFTLTTACAQEEVAEQQLHPQSQSNPFIDDNPNRLSNPIKDDLNVQFDDPFDNNTDVLPIPLVQRENHSYLPLDPLMDALGYNYVWDNDSQSYKIGDFDVVYEIKMNASSAMKADQPVYLENEPYFENGIPYVPIEVIDKLFQEDVNVALQQEQLFLYPTIDEDLTGEGSELSFAEDSADQLSSREGISAFALKDVNVSKLIATGKKYLGVKYEFGAEPYSKSKTFDCSSFTQHVYGIYGVDLPRISRNQAKKGVSVSRNNLKKGDLLFFYVPGRFKSNETVGHVGIYIGNNQMLHASPKPEDGVQITNINKDYWKETYLGARRVVK